MLVKRLLSLESEFAEMLAIDLTGRVALVTGAGTGIGFGCARCLCQARASVIVNDIRGEAANEAAQALIAEGYDAKAMQADVSDAVSVGRMLDGIGHLDILVNNAGFDYDKPIAQTPLSDWDRVHGVHLRGMFLMIKECLPKFGDRASIVNIASVHAIATEGGQAAYASAKAGIVSLTRAAALDLGPKVRVNVVCPGYIATRQLDHWLQFADDPEATMRRVIDLHPVGRIGTPEDIGNLVAFLASDLAAFVTGSAYVIDGGLISQLPS